MTSTELYEGYCQQAGELVIRQAADKDDAENVGKIVTLLLRQYITLTLLLGIVEAK